jgi:hypothetical protein
MRIFDSGDILALYLLSEITLCLWWYNLVQVGAGTGGCVRLAVSDWPGVAT